MLTVLGVRGTICYFNNICDLVLGKEVYIDIRQKGIKMDCINVA